MYVLVVGQASYTKPFTSMDGVACAVQDYMSLTPDLDLSKFDLICFTGGHDVDPSFYGEPKHRTTGSLLERDINEAQLYARALEQGIPMVGICRGSQFLTVMNGGKLIQHVDNHAISSTHPCKASLPPRDSKSGRCRYSFGVTSTHHQMMYPYTLDVGEYEILGYAESLSTSYGGLPMDDETFTDDKGNYKTGMLEPEVVWYKQTQCLAFQYHPEYMQPDSPAVKYFQNAILCYLFNKQEY